MKPVAFLALFPSLFTLHQFAIAAKAPLSIIRTDSKPFNSYIPNHFIIEVDDVSRIPTKRSLDAVYEHLQERAIPFKIKTEFNSPGIFSGAAIEIDTSEGVATLTNAPYIKDIQPMRGYPPPSPVKQQVLQGPQVSGIPDADSNHVMTGVDKLHEEGITGHGIKIGIIDTGVDYTHPNLGGAFGAGHKIIGGYDLVGDAYTGRNTPVPDDDPLDQCAGHGTHVAGIIGANPGNVFNISGVAYSAELNAYRIFGCAPDGFVTDDVIIAALLRGVNDGNDILTLSLGGPDGWTEGVSSVVASRIAKSGKIVTIAAGNDGAAGMFYSAGPANAIDAISVASVDSLSTPLQSVLVSGVAHDPIIYASARPFSITGSFPIYATSKDTTVPNDACEPLPDSTPDLSGYITIIRRGTCTFADKLRNAAAKGSRAIFVYDNGRGLGGIEGGDFQDISMITAADGEFLVTQFAAGTDIALIFPEGGNPVTYNDPHGGLSSSFSSYGPSNDYFFKPAVSAPGGNIVSTFPVPLGSFALLSGTSMSTPFVAGVSALLLQVKGKSKEVAHGARTLFETTAKYVPSSKDEKSLLETVAKQGAGLINAYDAVHATTIVTPGEFILNDTAHFDPVHILTIRNDGKTPKKYVLKHIAAATALSLREGTILPELGPVPLSNSSAKAVIFPDTVIVGPAQDQTVVVTFILPDDVPAARAPVYSGFIEVSGTSVSDTYHVSYIGSRGNLKDIQVLDDTDYFFDAKIPALVDSSENFQTSPTNYSFVSDDFPGFLLRLAFGSPLVRLDLVDPSTAFTPTVPLTHRRRGLSIHAGIKFGFPHDHSGGSFANVKVLGTINEYRYISRNDETLNTFYLYNLTSPAFANGTTIKNGQYRGLLRALRVTGNPRREEDYDSWLSPVFGINSVNGTA